MPKKQKNTTKTKRTNNPPVLGRRRYNSYGPCYDPNSMNFSSNYLYNHPNAVPNQPQEERQETSNNYRQQQNTPLPAHLAGNPWLQNNVSRIPVAHRSSLPYLRQPLVHPFPGLFIPNQRDFVNPSTRLIVPPQPSQAYPGGIVHSNSHSTQNREANAELDATAQPLDLTSRRSTNESNDVPSRHMLQDYENIGVTTASTHATTTGSGMTPRFPNIGSGVIDYVPQFFPYPVYITPRTIPAFGVPPVAVPGLGAPTLLSSLGLPAVNVLTTYATEESSRTPAALPIFATAPTGLTGLRIPTVNSYLTYSNISGSAALPSVKGAPRAITGLKPATEFTRDVSSATPATVPVFVTSPATVTNFGVPPVQKFTTYPSTSTLDEVPIFTNAQTPVTDFRDPTVSTIPSYLTDPNIFTPIAVPSFATTSTPVTSLTSHLSSTTPTAGSAFGTVSTTVTGLGVPTLSTTYTVDTSTTTSAPVPAFVTAPTTVTNITTTTNTEYRTRDIPTFSTTSTAVTNPGASTNIVFTTDASTLVSTALLSSATSTAVIGATTLKLNTFSTDVSSTTSVAITTFRTDSTALTDIGAATVTAFTSYDMGPSTSAVLNVPTFPATPVSDISPTRTTVPTVTTLSTDTFTTAPTSGIFPELSSTSTIPSYTRDASVPAFRIPAPPAVSFDGTASSVPAGNFVSAKNEGFATDLGNRTDLKPILDDGVVNDSEYVAPTSSLTVTSTSTLAKTKRKHKQKRRKYYTVKEASPADNKVNGIPKLIIKCASADDSEDETQEKFQSSPILNTEPAHPEATVQESQSDTQIDIRNNSTMTQQLQLRPQLENTINTEPERYNDQERVVHNDNQKQYFLKKENNPSDKDSSSKPENKPKKQKGKAVKTQKDESNTKCCGQSNTKRRVRKLSTTSETDIDDSSIIKSLCKNTNVNDTSTTRSTVSKAGSSSKTTGSNGSNTLADDIMSSKASTSRCNNTSSRIDGNTSPRPSTSADFNSSTRCSTSTTTKASIKTRTSPKPGTSPKSKSTSKSKSSVKSRTSPRHRISPRYRISLRSRTRARTTNVSYNTSSRTCTRASNSINAGTSNNMNIENATHRVESYNTSNLLNNVGLVRKRKISESESDSNPDFSSKKTPKVDLEQVNDIQFVAFPKDAQDEYVALVTAKVRARKDDGDEQSDDDEVLIDSLENRPVYKVTQYSIYNDGKQLTYLDSKIMDKVALFFSGYLKSISDESSNFVLDNLVPVMNGGPILEWCIVGYETGENLVVSLTTASCDYILDESSKEYSIYMYELFYKLRLCKFVLEYLALNAWRNPPYEELIYYLVRCHMPPEYPEITEDGVLQYADFISDQVCKYDAYEERDDMIIGTDCMTRLCMLSGTTFAPGEPQVTVRRSHINPQRGKKPKYIVTKIVARVFHDFLHEKKWNLRYNKSNRCNVCGFCTISPCGYCTACKNMPKFGGMKSSRQLCFRNRCPNIVINEAIQARKEENESPKDIAVKHEDWPHPDTLNKVVQLLNEINYLGKTFYQLATLTSEEIRPGEFYLMRSEYIGEQGSIVRVIYLFEENDEQMFHGHVFVRGCQTILSEVAYSYEIFLSVCGNFKIRNIVQRVRVSYNFGVPQKSEFSTSANKTKAPLDFYCNFHYTAITCRFENAPDLYGQVQGVLPCSLCTEVTEKARYEEVQYEDGCINWKGLTYKVGSGVYLPPNTFGTEPFFPEKFQPKEPEEYDETIYTEKYRKGSKIHDGSNIGTSDPFCIGVILKIYRAEGTNSLKLLIRKYYRPHNFKHLPLKSFGLNEIYWSKEVMEIDFEKVIGMCYVLHESQIKIGKLDWFNEGPDRFYYKYSYERETQILHSLDSSNGLYPEYMKCIERTVEKDELPKHETLDKPLKTLHLCSGAGGFSFGLKLSGASEINWAIEPDKDAAETFQNQNPNAVCFTESCETLLDNVMHDRYDTEDGKQMPKKGEVEMICGSPPWRDFAGMTNSGDSVYTDFRTSLFATYLSYCEFYRPKYFIFEYFKCIALLNNAKLLKIAMCFFINLGYQCTFAVLQSGHYGVPENRQRLIIVAAQRDVKLPKFPEPTHVFNPRDSQLDVVIENNRYTNGLEWLHSAPLRTITVSDAISDLPPIETGSDVMTRDVDDNEEVSVTYRHLMSCNTSTLYDHVCVEPSALEKTRIDQIPREPGADWRDLPNISVDCGNGVMTKPIAYKYIKEEGKEPHRASGVCTCSNGKLCKPRQYQTNTLIPWALAHTADKHNWDGMYGRLELLGNIKTALTIPSTLAKQGRVLHPEQNRIISIREEARSQGFPDSYRFSGGHISRYKQIGNSVPPPLGKAIGREIIKAMKTREKT